MRADFDTLPEYSDHVLVDGGFDPLHSGHLAYLHAARSRGPLLCAVASDDQIREKGKIPLLPQAERVAILESLGIVSVVYAKDRPTEQVLEQLRPKVYAKGSDWRGKLPYEQIDVLARYGIPVLYTDTPKASSTDYLRAWALADADQSLDRLTASMKAQSVTPPETYDREYFAGDWRAEGNRYTFEKRREIEGRHPRILAEAFPFQSMLDVGCGPGYLVELLRELGIEAGGIDPSPAAKQMAVNKWTIQTYPHSCPPKMADVVICREVLEHLTVDQVTETVMHLFRLAKRAVYITTRFHTQSVFDVTDERDVDPTHQTLLTQPFLRALCVLNGGTRRRDLEAMIDWQKKGRVLVYSVH